jgi:hypothetical protein
MQRQLLMATHAVKAKLTETDGFVVDPLSRAQRAYSYTKPFAPQSKSPRVKTNLWRTGRDGIKGSKKK